MFYRHLTSLVVIGAISFIASSAPVSNEVDYGSLECPQSPNETLITPTCMILSTFFPTYFSRSLIKDGTKDAIFGICTTEVIHASPETIYAALLDFQSYALWNSFIVDVGLPTNVTSTPDDVYVGMSMKFTSQGLLEGIDTSSTEVISITENTGNAGYLLASWFYDDGVGGTGSRSEHPSVLVDLGNGSTRYLSYETYYAGWESGAVVLLKDALQRQFEVQGRDLKTYVENLT
ncbi:hypothetical protein F5B20DRAFT_577205 [Whalleya microplaca]|nr:hypothetical protein F5B20DRAFT_577205 [Whalleya microplaca]